MLKECEYVEEGVPEGHEDSFLKRHRAGHIRLLGILNQTPLGIGPFLRR